MTLRCTIVLDYEVSEAIDPDEFHDALRDHLESLDGLDFEVPELEGDSLIVCHCESVRDINVEELTD